MRRPWQFTRGEWAFYAIMLPVYVGFTTLLCLHGFAGVRRWPIKAAFALLVSVGDLLLLWANWPPVKARPGRRVTSGGCVRCGYDMAGNRSGTCPECGHNRSQDVTRWR